MKEILKINKPSENAAGFEPAKFPRTKKNPRICSMATWVGIAKKTAEWCSCLITPYLAVLTFRYKFIMFEKVRIIRLVHVAAQFSKIFPTQCQKQAKSRIISSEGILVVKVVTFCYS